MSTYCTTDHSENAISLPRRRTVIKRSTDSSDIHNAANITERCDGTENAYGTETANTNIAPPLFSHRDMNTERTCTSSVLYYLIAI